MLLLKKKERSCNIKQNKENSLKRMFDIINYLKIKQFVILEKEGVYEQNCFF